MQLAPESVQRLHGTDLYLVPQSVLVRAGAYLIDTVVLFVLTLPFVYGKSLQEVVNGPDAVSYQLAASGALCLYFFLWEGALGWTPGKRALRLRVVSLSGEPCGWRRALLRNLVLPIDLFFFGVIGAMSIASGFQRQRLGDRLAGTTVVRALPLALVPPPYVPADQETQRCRHCGALQPADRAVCEACGAALAAATAVRSSRPPTPSVAPSAVRRSRPPTPSATPSSVRRSRPPAPSAAPPSAARAPSPRQSPDSVPSRLGLELKAEDDGTRLTAARETLVEGSRDDVRLLAALVTGWSEGDRQFIIDVSRTLDGWRPRRVLEALRKDADAALAAAAAEALATVAQRSRAQNTGRARLPRDPVDERKPGG